MKFRESVFINNIHQSTMSKVIKYARKGVNFKNLLFDMAPETWQPWQPNYLQLSKANSNCQIWGSIPMN